MLSAPGCGTAARSRARATPRPDAIACERTTAKIAMPDLSAQIRPRPDGRMIILGGEATK
ncbi:hypothetical protein JMG10_43845 [Nostoc ellipsosporum NOK]|nr:hypothetical protein [Nostoc ellipsosporum NOK]